MLLADLSVDLFGKLFAFCDALSFREHAFLNQHLDFQVVLDLSELVNC